MMRVLTFIFIALIGFLGPWWLLIPAVLYYAFRYTAYELLILGFALDLSYGVDPLPCIYTGAAAIILLSIETLRPRLRAA